MQFLQYYGIDWLATVCGLLGVYFLGNKNKIGFVLFMGASTSWITFGVLTGSIAVVIGSSVFLMMHFRGWLSWRRDAKLSQTD
ncbi:MAG: hypothetical protein R2747_15065 [Pyrinomonadaceae bacterium]